MKLNHYVLVVGLACFIFANCTEEPTGTNEGLKIENNDSEISTEV